MLINQANLSTIYTGFKTVFNRGFEGAEAHHEEVAMKLTSMTREETYGWLGQFPKLREWLGDRIIHNLAAHGYTVKNRLFEDTLAVKRTDIEDDTFGLFAPIVEEMGKAAREHPDEIIFTLLKNGFSTNCYDGQFFFDTDHPVNNSSVSNFQSGPGPAWYLLDTSRPIKPLIYQERIPYDFQALTAETDENTFMRDEYLYGVRGRMNAGFGLWQLAYASQQPLDAANYEAARLAMRSLVGDEGRPLGIKPDMLVFPPALEGDAMRLINNGDRIEDVGGVPVAINNEWANTAKLVSSPWLI